MTEDKGSASLVMRGKNTAGNYLRWQKVIGAVFYQGLFQALTGQSQSDRFLEIGSGPGYQSAEVWRRYKPSEMIAIEPSRDMIEVAEKYLAGLGYPDRIRFIEGYVEDEELIRGLGQFNLIYSSLSMHHWADPVGGLRNLYRALKPDGLLVIYDFKPLLMSMHRHRNVGKVEEKSARSQDGYISNLMAGAGIGTYDVSTGFLFQTIKVLKS